MEFMVSRTSIPFNKKDRKPCPEAVRKSYIEVDERTVDDPAKVPIHHGERTWWYAEGQNHRVEDGHIKRDLRREGWFVEIPTLDALVDFICKYGQVVIYPVPDVPDHWLEIEIYDAWRE